MFFYLFNFFTIKFYYVFIWIYFSSEFCYNFVIYFHSAIYYKFFTFSSCCNSIISQIFL